MLKNQKSMKKLFTYLLCMLFPMMVLAQERTINGRVVDSETNEPIPGVNVIVLPSYRGTITDMDGNYSLTNVSSTDQLQYSFIGFANQTVEVGEQTTINVILVPDINELDEVIAVGYGVMKKSDLTGSVSSVGLEDINMTENITLDQALEGRVAGLNVSSGDGTLGGATEIFIRGVGSINSNTQPLFVIDGFPIEYSYDRERIALDEEDPLNPLVNINPDDIESIEVLKDASAAAIYGARGANGVIIITTKKGEAGKTNISLNARMGFKQPMKRMDMMESVDYAFYQHEQFSSDERWLTPETYKDSTNTDWQEQVFSQGAALSQSYDLAIDGGSEQTTFRTNINFTDESGVVKGSSLEKFSGSFKLNHKAGRWLDMFTDINLATSGNQTSGTGGTGGTYKGYGSVMKALLTPPTKDPFYVPTDEELDADGTDLSNPLTSMNNSQNIKKNSEMRINTRFMFKLHPSLTLMVRGGYRMSFAERRQFYPSTTSKGKNTNGLSSFSTNNKSTLLGESTLTYLNTFNKVHNVNAVVGLSYTKNTDWYNDAANSDYQYSDLGIYNIGVGVDPYVPQSWYEEPKLQSTLGRLNYNYDNRYFATFAYRIDGSNKFGTGHKYAYFPSGAVSWRASEEAFLQGAEWLDNLKVRASFGITGNQGIPSLLSRDNYGLHKYILNGSLTSGVALNNVRDDNLKWETSEMIDAGIDFLAFNQRLSVTFDVYRKDTYDLLLNNNVASQSGYVTDWTNVGSMRNEGFEIALRGDVIKQAGFKWTLSANYARNENKVLKLNGESDHMIMDDYILQEGQPVGTFYGVISDGIFHTDAEAEAGPVEQKYIGENRPGYRRFIDQDGDGIITPDDRVKIGKGHPDGFGSLSNSFKYKGLELRMMFTFRHGSEIYNGTRKKLEEMFDNKNKNKLATITNRWRPENSYYFGDEGNPTNDEFANGVRAELPWVRYDDKLFQTYHIESGDYIKFRSVTLQYRFPSNIAQKIGMKQLSVRTTFENIYTWTKYTGYDPEVSMGKNKGLMPGMDNAGAPTPFVYSFGVNARF